MKIEKKKMDIDLFEKTCNQNGIYFEKSRNVEGKVKVIDSNGRVLTIKNGKKNSMSQSAMKRNLLLIGGNKVGIVAHRKSNLKKRKK